MKIIIIIIIIINNEDTLVMSPITLDSILRLQCEKFIVETKLIPNLL